MAIWQYEPMLVPRGGPAVRGTWGEVHWRNQPEVTVESLAGQLPAEAKSWSPRLRIWGDPERDSLTAISSASGRLEVIKATIDARQPNSQFISTLCSVATALNAVFLDRDEREIEPIPSLLRDALNTSRAMRFVLRGATLPHPRNN